MTRDITDPVMFALDEMEEAAQAALAHPMPGVPDSERELERLNCIDDLEAIDRVRRLWAEMANSSTALIIAETMRKDAR